MYKGRNYTKRIEIYKTIQAITEERQKALEAIPEGLSEEEEENLFAELCEKYDTTGMANKMYSLEYPKVKNAWFKSFVESFGTCEHRQITAKQANIFLRYGEADHYKSPDHGMKVCCNVNNLFIQAYIYPDCGYITIKEIKEN